MVQHYREGDEPIPGYRLEKFLGEGGFGQVWKAAAPGGTEAALKIIDLHGVYGRKEFRALRLVKRIRHPNLVPITAVWLKSADGSILDDAFVEQKDLPLPDSPTRELADTMVAPPEFGCPQAAELVFAMGLGDKSLFHRLEECRQQGLEGIPEEELLGYMEEAAKAIDYLNSPVHDLGAGPVAIQHCDIKPHNLMLVGNSTQVCDFGLARDMGVTRTTAATAATIAYAAPESLEGKPSASTDQYGLAITYYELRTGQLPYREKTCAAVTKAVIAGDLDFSKLPAAEQRVLGRATARDPKDRYPSTLEMVKALRRASAGVPDRPPGGARKPSLATVLALLALAAIVAFVAWNTISPGRRNRVRSMVGLGKEEGENRQISEPKPKNGGQADADRGQKEPAQDIRAHAEDVFQDGTEHLRSGRYDEAIRCYEELTRRIDSEGSLGYKTRPEYADAYRGRGGKFLEQGEYDSAVSDFTEALRHSQDPDLFRFRGEALLANKAWQAAVDDFTNAISIDGNDIDLVNRGRAYMGLELPDKAAADFNEAIRRNDRNADAHFYRGTLYLADKQYDQAIEDFQTARSIDPAYESRGEYAEAYLARGTGFLLKSQVDEAIEDYNQGIVHNPDDARLYSRLAAAWFFQGEWQKVIENSSKALEIDESDVDLIKRGRAYEKLGQTDKAIADFKRASQVNPENGDSHYLLGVGYMNSEAYQDAVDAFTQAIQQHPKTSDPIYDLAHTYLYRANCYLQLGRLDEAANDFTQTLQRRGELDPRDLEGQIAGKLHKLAAEFAKAGQFSEAAHWERAAMELIPDEERKKVYRSLLERYEAALSPHKQ